MKTIYFILLACPLIFCDTACAQTIEWYYTTDGVNGSGWPYVDAYIPPNMKLDSVFCGLQRPTVPDESGEDCASAWVYGPDYASGTGYTEPWFYPDVDSSLYNYWINLTAFNFVGEGVFRLAFPEGADPVIFDSLGIAMTSTAGINDLVNERIVFVYPNPATETINVDVAGSFAYAIYDITGSRVTEGFGYGHATIESTNWKKGAYYIEVDDFCRLRFVVQ